MRQPLIVAVFVSAAAAVGFSQTLGTVDGSPTGFVIWSSTELETIANRLELEKNCPDNRREAAFSEVSWYTEIRKIHVRETLKTTQNPKFATWRYDSTVGAAALGILLGGIVCTTPRAKF